MSHNAPLYQVESLCMRCDKNGITRFLLTVIPNFRQVLLSVFECPHCEERNNGVEFAGDLQPKGCRYTLAVNPIEEKIPELDFEILPEAQRGSLSTIPYFQEVIVMASSCDSCGYRNSELKPGGRIPDKGKKILCSRDLIKLDTASVIILGIELELSSGTLGGVVTTVEGLITKISESWERVHGFTFREGLEEDRKNKWIDFRSRLDKLLSLGRPWTLILVDALANVCDDIQDDRQLSFEEYERTWEHNEELGQNDIDTSSADVAYNSSNNADSTAEI